MKIFIHVISKSDPNQVDRLNWPDGAPLLLPRIGEQFQHSTLGVRPVVSITYVYGKEQGNQNVGDVNIHLGLD